MESRPTEGEELMAWRQPFWLAFGVFAQLLFALTVCRLFPFLRGEAYFQGLASPAPGQARYWFLADGLLALQFAVVHSVLLLPAVRSRLARWVPSALYGCLFCVATCVCLLTAMELWQPSPFALWRLQGAAAKGVDALFLLSWVALLYSLYLTGLGYQTGLTPFLAWARGRSVPKREFAPRGAYRYLRHPVYLSFLGLIWFNPVMTLDRLTLAVAWSAHIFIGSYLKDRRLVHYIGDQYRSYQRRVPGYPFIPYGPLARHKPAAAPAEAPA
ncbi:MAG: NnrU family protein [Isosphaeraceae bacterium]